MRRRRYTATLAALFSGLLATVVFAVVPSVAAASETGWGYIEICKTFNAGPTGAPKYQGSFTYHVADGGYVGNVTINALQGGPQVCTAPLSVPVGTATVTEQGAPWFSVDSITATPGDPGTVTPGSAAGVATLSVNQAPAPGDQSMTTIVQYTNDPVYGTIEVCKQAASNSSSLTGTYSFNVTSTDAGVNVFDSETGAYDLPWSTTTTATISGAGLGCSGPITVPAGTVSTEEPGTTYVTGITATADGANALISPAPNLALGTANEEVLAGDTTNQTIVTYTDALSTVKLCKAWAGDSSPTTSFPFAVSSSGPAGPTAVAGTVGLNAGDCQILGEVRAGTRVNITEGVVPGTKVDGIDVSPTSNSQGNSPIVPDSLSLPNRTLSIIAGAGETVVTFTDGPADPGWLKICVAPTTNPAAGTVPFTVNGSQTIDVNLSSTAMQCTLDPNTFAFNSAVKIVGGSLPGSDAFTGMPSVVPTNVEVLEGGVPTPTNQMSLSASTASTATVLMSEGIVDEITFTVDPPAPATAPTVTATPTVAQVAAESAALPAVKGSSGVDAAAARAQRLRRQLSADRAQIRALTRRLASHHLSRAARRADRRRLAALRAQEHRLLRQLL
ncbi:MAG: hypothetical protein KGL16_02405 [Acidobacteriota bacterium]|nr:hypothetical protein [Acidobacteriota bacterium]